MSLANIQNTVSTNCSTLASTAKAGASWCGHNVSYTLNACRSMAGKTVSCSRLILNSGYRGACATLQSCTTGASAAWKFSAQGIHATANKITACSRPLFAQLKCVAKASARAIQPGIALAKGHPTATLALGGLALAAAGWAAYNRFTTQSTS